MSSSARDAVLRDLLIILGVAGVFLLPSLASRDLWNPDEPRYMEVAREMVVRGDYLIPHLNGEVYPDKPPLFFWLTAGLYHMGFGNNSGRIVAAAATVGTLLLTYFLAGRLIPRPGPLLAALTTMTAGVFLAFSRTGVIDPLLTLLVTASIYSGFCALQPETRRRGLCWLLCYFAAGLAVLTKGPMGAIVPFLVLLCFWLIRRKALRAGGWLHAAGALILVAVVGAWLGPALVRGGADYAHAILVKQNIGRLVRSYSHRNPIYYYLMYAPVMLMPWPFLFALAVAAAMGALRRSREPAAALGLAWMAAVFVAFSAISGKRPGYVMPAVPAFGLLMGGYLAKGLRDGFPWPRLHDALVSVSLFALSLAGILAVAAMAAAGKICLMKYPNEPALYQTVTDLSRAALFWTVPGVCLGILLAWIGWRQSVRKGRRALACPAVILMLVLFSVIADAVVIPGTNVLKSGKAFGRVARPYVEVADEAFLYRSDFSGMYNLHLEQSRMPVLATVEELRQALSRPGKIAVIGREAHVSNALQAVSGTGRVAARGWVGHRKMCVVVNWDPAED